MCCGVHCAATHARRYAHVITLGCTCWKAPACTAECRRRRTRGEGRARARGRARGRASGARARARTCPPHRRRCPGPSVSARARAPAQVAAAAAGVAGAFFAYRRWMAYRQELLDEQAAAGYYVSATGTVGPRASARAPRCVQARAPSAKCAPRGRDSDGRGAAAARAAQARSDLRTRIS